MYKWDRWLRNASDFLLQSAFVIGMVFVNIFLVLLGGALLVGFTQMIIETLGGM